MEDFGNLKSVKNVVFVLTIVCFYFVHCSPGRPISYREGVDQEQITTSKLNRDRLNFKKERSKFFPSNSNFETRSKEEDVKSVLPGDNTMWQSADDDDDDDDDGGEYEGVDYNSRQDLETKRKNEDVLCKPPESVPMMLIRQVDMVAMKIPVEEAKNIKNSKELQGFKSVESFNASKNFNGVDDSKSCKFKTGSRKQKQEWSRWSPCSKPCGKGVQSRWRIKPGLQERERQLRPCNLGDCSNSRDFQLHPSYP